MCSAMPAFASLVKLLIQGNRVRFSRLHTIANMPLKRDESSKKASRSKPSDNASYVELMEISRVKNLADGGMVPPRHEGPLRTVISSDGITRSMAMEVCYERDM